jgi:hypothetical protein
MESSNPHFARVNDFLINYQRQQQKEQQKARRQALMQQQQARLPAAKPAAAPKPAAKPAVKPEVNEDEEVMVCHILLKRKRNPGTLPTQHLTLLDMSYAACTHSALIQAC